VDLFAIADSLVARVGGIVIIEDADRLPIAHSTGPALMDRPALAEAVVRRRPSPVSEDAGVHALVMRSHQPTFLPADDAGAGDVAMPIRAGTEILGCVWAIGVENSSESRSLVLEAARRCREHLSRTRLEGDWARRRREDRLRLLLQGSAVDLQLSSDLGLGVASTARVLAFGPAPDQQATWSLLGRAALLAQNAADAHRVSMATAPSLELTCSYGLLTGDHDYPTIARFGSALVAELERRLGGVWRLAVGDPVASVRDLPTSTQQAEQVLAALHGDFGGRSVAVEGEVATAIYLDRVQALLRSDGDLPRGPVAAIRLYDAAEATDYVTTLTAWIDARSDTSDASAALFIHPNTLRYRLKRIEELFALDLSDPDVRLAITLQLRLHRTPPHGE
jgi:sugar diacid utilization regulator